MYRQNPAQKTTIEQNTGYVAERLEMKIKRIMTNNEPISDGSPLIYTERKDGVLPAYNPKTDRFDVAIDAMDKVSKTHKAKREERLKPKEEAPKDTNQTQPNKNDTIEPTPGTK
jgi:hypothetical protein